MTQEQIEQQIKTALKRLDTAINEFAEARIAVAGFDWLNLDLETKYDICKTMVKLEKNCTAVYMRLEDLTTLEY